MVKEESGRQEGARDQGWPLPPLSACSSRQSGHHIDGLWAEKERIGHGHVGSSVPAHLRLPGLDE